MIILYTLYRQGIQYMSFIIIYHTGVLQLMLINNDQLLLECVRVLGNISKQPAVRDILAANRGTCTTHCVM